MSKSLVKCAAAIAALVGSACAQTDLYIGEYKYQDARMTAVRTDGANPRTMFALPSNLWLPLGITVNPVNQRLYWLDAAGGAKVVSSALDGTGLVQMPHPGYGRGASLDALGRFYYSEAGVLYRTLSDGTGRVALFTGTTPNTMGNPRVDITNGHVYVGSDGRIYRMNLDGSNVKVILRGCSIVRAIGLDLARGYIYWIDADTLSDFVGRARLDGSDFRVLIDNTPLAAGSSGLLDLVVDPASGTLFIADEFRDDVRSYPIDGGAHSVVFTCTLDRSPSGLVLSTGEPIQPLLDCNGNGISDTAEIAAGAADCDNNGYLDSCQVRACEPRVLLLDNGSDAANTQGRAVGIPSQWQQFQPFDVPAGGWVVGEVGIDGNYYNFADGSGLTATFFPDAGSGQAPDESFVLGVSHPTLTFNTYEVNWQYAPIEPIGSPGATALNLPQGRYWIRLEASEPTLTGATLNYGFTGLTGWGRGVSGNFVASGRSFAFRLAQGVNAPPCPADFNQDGGIDGSDVEAFFVVWESGEAGGDVNADGGVDGADIERFMTVWEAGGC